uniref:Uncharacterized protein n=1 Tax=Anguilla anguilla TaxID=7936 RepID=A0A0E9TUW0_ANGAN
MEKQLLKQEILPP